jgi:hypothetical protein
MAGLWNALKQYIGDALPGGALNPETQPVATQANYLSGILDPASQVSQDAQAWHKRTQNGLMDQLAGRDTPEAEQAYQTMMQAAGMAPVGMIAWHGSPHKFDKFSLDKIGTGEGAQAYGHGLYVAESPDVAKSYAGSVSTTKDIGGQFLKGAKKDGAAREVYSMYASGYTPQAVDYAIQKIADNEGPSSSYLKAMQKAHKKVSETIAQNGNLYKTDIPDEAVARFLDWDKPLSQQAPEVQAALGEYRDTDKAKIINLIRIGEQPNGFGVVKSGSGYAPVVNGEVVGNGAKDLVFGSHDEAINYIAKQIPETDPTGASIYRRMVGERGGADGISQAQVSNLLHQQGIPGIRYLDGGSRGAGTGTSNFVAFDPELIRILERNGQPTGLQPWKPGEWKR